MSNLLARCAQGILGDKSVSLTLIEGMCHACSGCSCTLWSFDLATHCVQSNPTATCYQNHAQQYALANTIVGLQNLALKDPNAYNADKTEQGVMSAHPESDEHASIPMVIWFVWLQTVCTTSWGRTVCFRVLHLCATATYFTSKLSKCESTY